MKKQVIIPLIIAGVLVILGLIVLGIGYAMGGTSWLFRSANYEDKTAEFNGSFSSIRVESDSCDVRFAIAENGKQRVEARLQENMTITAEIESNTLVVKCKDKRKWFQLIGLQAQDSKLTVFVSEAEFDSLKLATASGNVYISNDFSFNTAEIATASGDVNLQADIRDKLLLTTSSGDLKLDGINSKPNIKLSTSSGDFVLKSITCSDFIISLSSGDFTASNVYAENFTVKCASSDILLDNVICSDKMNINTASGNVNFKRCDAANVDIKTASGDVEGSFKTSKVFNVHTASGDVRVPQDGNGGNCKVNTASGDIIISIVG